MVARRRFTRLRSHFAEGVHGGDQDERNEPERRVSANDHYPPRELNEERPAEEKEFFAIEQKTGPPIRMLPSFVDLPGGGQHGCRQAEGIAGAATLPCRIDEPHDGQGRDDRDAELADQNGRRAAAGRERPGQKCSPPHGPRITPDCHGHGGEKRDVRHEGQAHAKHERRAGDAQGQQIGRPPAQPVLKAQAAKRRQSDKHRPIVEIRRTANESPNKRQNRAPTRFERGDWRRSTR